jgi:hypothetical protein
VKPSISNLDVAMFITTFNQLADIHVINILAIAEQEPISVPSSVEVFG